MPPFGPPGNSSVVPGHCACDTFWSGDACGIRYDHKLGGWWTAFIAVTAVLQGMVLVVGITNLIQRELAMRTMRQHKRAFRGSYRDIIQLLVMAGSALRCAWLVDPENFNHIYSQGVAWGVLMRLPQIAWTLAFNYMLLMWNAVLRSIHDDARRNKCIMMYVIVSSFLLFTICVPSSIMYSLDYFQKELWFVGNSVMVLYCLVWLGVGSKMCVQVYKLLKEHRRHATQEQLARFSRAMRVTLRTFVMAVFFGSITIGLVAVSIGLHVGPNNTPYFFMSFLYGVHAVSEPGLAWTLLYAAYQRPVASWRLICCRSARESSGMLASINSMSSPGASDTAGYGSGPVLGVIASPAVARRPHLRQDTSSNASMSTFALLAEGPGRSSRKFLAAEDSDSPFGYMIARPQSGQPSALYRSASAGRMLPPSIGAGSPPSPSARRRAGYLPPPSTQSVSSSTHAQYGSRGSTTVAVRD